MYGVRNSLQIPERLSCLHTRTLAGFDEFTTQRQGLHMKEIFIGSDEFNDIPGAHDI